MMNGEGCMVMTQQSGDRHSCFQDDFSKRVHFFPRPPEGFNPLTVRPCQLDTFFVLEGLEL